VLGTRKYLWYEPECLKRAIHDVWHQRWASILDRPCRPQSSPMGTMLSRRTSLESYRIHVGPYKLLHGSWTCEVHRSYESNICIHRSVRLLQPHINSADTAPLHIRYTHHGSNSCMILSNRMTANNRAEKPDTHAKKRMANVMRLFHPAGLVSNDFILTLESAGSKQTRDRHTGELNPYANITGNCPSLP